MLCAPRVMKRSECDVGAEVPAHKGGEVGCGVGCRGHGSASGAGGVCGCVQWQCSTTGGACASVGVSAAGSAGVVQKRRRQPWRTPSKTPGRTSSHVKHCPGCSVRRRSSSPAPNATVHSLSSHADGSPCVVGSSLVGGGDEVGTFGVDVSVILLREGKNENDLFKENKKIFRNDVTR